MNCEAKKQPRQVDQPPSGGLRRLVGTVEQVREQADGWKELGVETLIVGPGCVPFQFAALEDLEPLAEALR